MARIKEFIGECIRVLHVTKKPDKQEYLTVVKVSALGIGIIGFLGFVITMLALLIRG
jgi:protein transport protein SEC61 subunit gamma-like protein